MAERESTSRRQYLRDYCLDVARRAIHSQFCTVGRSGNNVWPDNMPRNVRRAIERDRAKREFNTAKA